MAFCPRAARWSAFGSRRRRIGKTSAVTFQVVGHAKTCLVLAGGYLFFPSHGKHNQEQLYHNIMGVSVAMVGVLDAPPRGMRAREQRPRCLLPMCVCVVRVPRSLSRVCAPSCVRVRLAQSWGGR